MAHSGHLSSKALAKFRICDLSGQLAGAGATRFLAAFGAQVIRVEDPSNQGRWDILRGADPSSMFGGAFNNHNVEKLGVTINLRTDRGKDLFKRLVAVSDVVTENFSSGVLDRLGLGYSTLQEVRPDIILVSNSGFGKSGPYANFKTFGPIVQACSGLTFSSGRPEMPPAGWGYSFMDHMGAYFMAFAILAALVERTRTGQGQQIDMSCTDAGLTLAGPELLDFTVNGRRMRREGSPDSNRSNYPAMAPHGIYPAAGDDSWVAIACRDEDDWRALTTVISGLGDDTRYQDRESRIRQRDDLDDTISGWTRQRARSDVQQTLRAAGLPVAQVASPQDRMEFDPVTARWHLWPWVDDAQIGRVRVEGLPVHMSDSDWVIERGSPTLGEHNHQVFAEILGLSDDEIKQLSEDAVI
jgi:benzylsuccinate CoA-transferase BbsF subunit